jgi:hypothetical protein
MELRGFADFLALKGTEILSVQLPSASNVSSRGLKFAESPLLDAVREASIRVNCPRLT